MSYTLTLQYRMSQTADPAVQPTAVQLELVVQSVTGFPDTGLFLFQRDVAGRPLYAGVVTPKDLQDYALDTEIDGKTRRSSVVQTYPTADRAESALDATRTILRELSELLDALQVYGEPQTEVIP